MIELWREAGFAAWLCLIFFGAGIAVLVTKRGSVSPWAIAVVAAGALGDGLGMRLVSKAAEGAPSLPEKVTYLSIGSKEAAANLIIAGIFALVLLLVGAIATAVRAKQS
jgi:hypothetical protein